MGTGGPCQSFYAERLLHCRISALVMTALGLGCVKTFWRGRTPASTNSRIPGQAKLAMFLQLRAGIDCIACPAAVSDLVVVSRIWARRCPALTPGSPP